MLGHALFGIFEGQAVRELYVQAPPQGQTLPVSTSMPGIAMVFINNQSGSGIISMAQWLAFALHTNVTPVRFQPEQISKKYFLSRNRL